MNGFQARSVGRLAEGDSHDSDYIATDKGDRYGTLRYSTSLRTDNLDALDEEFRPFREHFGVGIETRA